jgi:hypothetical protein
MMPIGGKRDEIARSVYVVTTGQTKPFVQAQHLQVPSNKQSAWKKHGNASCCDSINPSVDAKLQALA